MHRVLITVVPLTLCTIMLAGCGSLGKSSVTTQAASSAPTATGSTTASAPASSSPAATVGSTIDLTGEADATIAITLVQVVNPATGSDEFNQPDAGDQLVGVQFQIKNTGTGTYSDDPDTDAVLIDSHGQQYQPTFDTLSEGASLNSGLVLAAGDTTLGFEVFQVPSGTSVAQVQYQLNAGFGEHTAQWNVG